MIEGFESTVHLHVLGNLGVHLVQVLVDVPVALRELLLGELGNLTLHHGVLVSEEAVRSSEEAFKSNDFLQESKLGVCLLINCGLSLCSLLLLNGVLNSGVDLLVDLSG